MGTATHDDGYGQAEELVRFLNDYYRDEIGRLAQRYPNDQESLAISWRDLYRFDPDIASDYLTDPATVREWLQTALRNLDLPIDVPFEEAHIRVHDLSDEHTHYPGAFSPTEHAGAFRAIKGEISKATDVYSRITTAAFECQRCGTLTQIRQSDDGEDFQEPHECQGCERQGPFQINFDQSAFVDAQQLRIQMPPEVASGAGAELDVYVEADLADHAEVGDRVTVTGTIHLAQQSSGNTTTGKFDPYLDAEHITLQETDHTDLDVTNEQRERIRALADGTEGDPLDVAADSLAPKIHGHDRLKRMLILALVGGARVTYPSGDADRGDFHVLLLGDPGTAKSQLIERAEQLGWRTVGVSGKGATAAGVTASAVQDDFGDGEWTLKAGAFVKANDGVVCVDELDDMPADVRAAMNEPMSKQTIHVSKGGINTHLSTRAAVIAAANPANGRFDSYEPIQQQVTFDATLISRFDLIFTLTDRPDPDRDGDIADHMLSARDAAKRRTADNKTDAADTEVIDPPVDRETLRAWIGLAKQQPAPPFASEAVRERIRDQFTELRGLYQYDENSPVPVTFRSLQAVVRIAEAAARFEFADEITARHAKIATEAVGQSMQDVGRNEDGELDADIKETGTSQSQRDRKQAIKEALTDLATEHQGGVPFDELAESLSLSTDQLTGEIRSLKKVGIIVEPTSDHYRWIGRV